MFSILSKNISLKKTVKKSLNRYSHFFTTDKVQTIGIIVDQTQFSQTEAMVQQLQVLVPSLKKVNVLIYKDKIAKNETYPEPYYDANDLSNAGIFQKNTVLDFLYTPFDLLISYYNTDKPSLALATIQSKANFKAGLAGTDTQLHQFIIQSETQNYSEFITELVRYLKILKKL